MAIETELKARVSDLEAIRARLPRLGAVRGDARAFEDNWLFDTADGQLGRRGETLRVRRWGDRVLLTWKGPKQIRDGIKSREEIELWCEDDATLVAILGKLGFEPRLRYQKYRESWHLDDTEVLLDETPLGEFIEIEGRRPAVAAVRDRLGITAEQVIVESYAALAVRDLDARDDTSGELVFE